MSAILFSVCLSFSACNGQAQKQTKDDLVKGNCAKNNDPNKQVSVGQFDFFNNPANKLDTTCYKMAETSKISTPKLQKSAWAKKTDNIVCSLKDKKGRIWFGSTGGGVYCYENKLFTQYTTKDGLSQNNVYTIYEDTNGIIWFGTADGITTWDRKSFTKISITTIRGKNAKSYEPTTIDTLYGVISQDNQIDDIIQDSKGDFWLAGYKEVYRYDGRTFTNFTINDGIANNTGVQFGWIEKIMEDKDKKIWFGGRSNKGLFCFDGKNLTNTNPNDQMWLQPLLKDDNNNMLFGNFDGICRYNGKSFEQFLDKKKLCFGRISNVFKDKANNFWIFGDNRENGTGICKYDGKSFQYFPISEGRTQKITNSMIEDNEGNLWVSVSGCDLYRFDGKTFTLFSE